MSYNMHSRTDYIQKIESKEDAVGWLKKQADIFGGNLNDEMSKEEVLDTLKGFAHTLVQMTNTLVKFNEE